MEKMTDLYENVAIIIPARLGSSRLPNKPIALIGNKTMIEHVYSSVKRTGAQYIYVATDSENISHLIQDLGGKTIVTTGQHLSGTDRIYEAYNTILNTSHEDIKYIINVQGDMPFIAVDTIEKVTRLIKEGDCEIVTPVARGQETVRENPVHVLVGENDVVLDFSRKPMTPRQSSHSVLPHVGIYGYTAKSLEKFCKLPPSGREKAECLEQLRGLENGMKIRVCSANTTEIIVDTQGDLDYAREQCAERCGTINI